MFPMAKRVIAGFLALCRCRAGKKECVMKSSGGDGGNLDHYISI